MIGKFKKWRLRSKNRSIIMDKALDMMLYSMAHQDEHNSVDCELCGVTVAIGIELKQELGETHLKEIT